MENTQRFPSFVLVVMTSTFIIPIILFSAISVTTNRSYFVPLGAFVFGITLISLTQIRYIFNVVLISIAVICFQICFVELFIMYIKSVLAENELYGKEMFEKECMFMWEYAIIIHSKGFIE